jgi:chromosome segregation ATPase
VAFGKRTPPAAPSPGPAPAPSAATEKVAALTGRRDSLARRRDAAGLEADELRRALDVAAVAGEETSRLAEELVATEGRSKALSLEIAAVEKALRAAEAEVAAEREAARIARLGAQHAECEKRFLDAERTFKAAVRALSATIAPAVAAARDLDDAARAVGKTPYPFRPEDADEDLVAELRGGSGIEYLRLEVPWTV